MQTVTIDIINNKAIKLLNDLETLQLIYVRKEKRSSAATSSNRVAKYKGAMSKQPMGDIDKQFNELRRNIGDFKKVDTLKIIDPFTL
jgi:hypothetical protein